jgi:hypothetical protein
MASYGEALSTKPKGMKMPKNELREMVLRKADNGGIVAEHRMSNFEGHAPMHTFSAGEGAKFAAHISKHLGMQIPGNVADGKETEDAEA